MFLAQSVCFAQQADIEPEVFVYKVKSGDTLQQISLKYLQQPVDVATLKNSVELPTSIK